MADIEKAASVKSARQVPTPEQFPVDEEVGTINGSNALKRDLKGRHMQMIAIGMRCLLCALSLRLSLVSIY